MNGMKVFGTPTNSLDQFRKLCEFAVKHNGTHVFVSDLPDSQWQWELDPYDPYPSWNMKSASIFKIITPEPIKPWVDQEYAEMAEELIYNRGLILREYNLKGAFSGIEPSYLEKGVYEAYPDWRGPACEKPKRARKAYYAPCIDNPEVLGMYRRSVKKLCELAQIEYFSFLCNDSGAGICWSQGLYPGMNGNSNCENVVMGDRIKRFMSTLQAGANDAGCSAIVAMGGSVPKVEVDAVVKYLDKNQVFQGQTADGKAISCGMGMSNTFFATGLYPVKYLPLPLTYIQGYSSMMNSLEKDGSLDAFIYFEQVETDYLYDLFDFMTNHEVPQNNKQCCDLLFKYCEEKVGAENANDLYEIYENIEKARNEIRNIQGDGPVLTTGTVNQRWLTRPLVPRPLDLPSEDRDYYRKYLFQANSEEEAEDLANMQGTRFLGGHGAMLLTMRYVTDSLNDTKRAISLAQKLQNAVLSQAQKKEFNLLERKLRVLACIYRNINNVVNFQERMDKTDFVNPPFERQDKWQKGDQILHEVNNIVRNELDNMQDLLKVLKTGVNDLMEVAETPEKENVFIFSPDIISHIEKKVKIMNKYKDDFEKYYTRNS